MTVLEGLTQLFRSWSYPRIGVPRGTGAEAHLFCIWTRAWKARSSTVADTVIVESL